MIGFSGAIVGPNKAGIIQALRYIADELEKWPKETTNEAGGLPVGIDGYADYDFDVFETSETDVYEMYSGPVLAFAERYGFVKNDTTKEERNNV